MRKLLSFFSIFITLVFISASSKAAPLVVGQIAEPKSLDPATVTAVNDFRICLLYTSPSPRDAHESRMPSSA